MKKMISSILLLTAVTLFGCSKSDDTPEELPEAKITISPANPVVGFKGETLTITVDANADWNVSTQSDFCTLSRKGGIKGTSEFEAVVAPNTTSKSRTAILNFVAGKKTLEYTITQDYDQEAFKPDNGSSYPAPDGYNLVWHDEFDSGTELNPSDWTHEVQKSGWVNNELQNYVNGIHNGTRVTEINDGKLKITCFKDTDGKVYSGRVYAHVKTGWQYGYIEAKIKLPKGKGTWPAFWMMPVKVNWANEGWPKCGEIDIMEEVGYHANYVSSSLHAEGHVHTLGNQVTHEMLCKGAEDDFHTYAIEWTKEKIITYVDGKVQLTYKSDGTVKNYPYDKPFYLILNLAWGGDWGGNQGVDESALPTVMEVDYVRVFQK